MCQQLVTVVVPVYTSQMNDDEQRSIAHNLEVLKAYPVVFVVPEGLDYLPPKKEAKVFTVSSNWLGARGLKGYNEMMLSAEFYERFDSKYILICQPDAWVFRDELVDWCNKDYDYVGAPWLRFGLWDVPLIKYLYRKNRRLHGKIGNGGLSLRRVDACKQVCTSQRERINVYLSQHHHTYGEDVFWAVEPKGFRYPTKMEALHFSIDGQPEKAMHTNGGRLPMGCHGWCKQQRKEFWLKYIK